MVLKEEESDAISGGVTYYDPTGMYLGQMGSDPDIRIVGQYAYNQENIIGESALYSQSSSLNNSSYSTKYYIINDLAKQVGITTGGT